MTRFKKAMQQAEQEYHATQYPGDILADIRPIPKRRLHWPVAIAASLLIAGVIFLLQFPQVPDSAAPQSASQATHPSPTRSPLSIASTPTAPNPSIAQRAGSKQRFGTMTTLKLSAVKDISKKRLALSGLKLRTPKPEKSS